MEVTDNTPSDTEGPKFRGGDSATNRNMISNTASLGEKDLSVKAPDAPQFNDDGNSVDNEFLASVDPSDDDSPNASVTISDAAKFSELSKSVIGEMQSSPDDLPDGGMPDPIEGLKKKKKKRKSRFGKTQRAITGFEEYFADGPTTPNEHAEDKKLYSADNSFAQRIELAIQRYRQKRRFDSQRAFLFDKFLALGGVDTSQRMFQGFDPLEANNSDLTKDEIRDMTARDVIHVGTGGSKFYDPDEPGAWTVNFAVIVKGFLSRWVTENYPRSDQGSHFDNEQAATLIHNFLSYIQMHDVCPEYNSQILTAKAICNIAPTELRHARELYFDLCDPFNGAAKFLFCDGGVFEIARSSTTHGTAAQDQLDFSGRDSDMKARKLDPFTQLVIFRLTVMDVTRDTEHPVADDNPCNIRVESTKVETYQVVSVHRRKKKEKATLEKLLREQSLDGKVKPAGTMVLRPSMIDHAYSNAPRPKEIDFSNEPTVKLIMDDDVLAKVQPGMKIQVEICKLNIGVTFIKKVLDVRVTFDTLLPQSLMLNWKDPVANDRPAPSADTPTMEDEYAEGDDFQD